MLFSSILLIHLWLGMGHDIVGLLYEPASLLHLTSYLFVAFLTGYFADRRDQERHELRWEKNEQKEQYRELLQAYNACMDTKDALYRQIVNSDDSIGRIYNIIRRLDSVDVEQVFDQAASVTAEILNVHDIAIYGLRFEQWSLSQQNLLSVTMRLIASSLGRARQFESEAEERRYCRGCCSAASVRRRQIWIRVCIFCISCGIHIRMQSWMRSWHPVCTLVISSAL